MRVISILYPEGYCSFGDIPRVLVEHPEWMYPPLPLDIVQLKEHFNRPEAFDDDDDRRTAPLHLVKGLIQRLAQPLITGEVRAAATLPSGKIAWVPPEVWRIETVIGGIRLQAPILTAFSGFRISIPRIDKGSDYACPIIALNDLALVFGATKPPLPPKFQPDYLPEHFPNGGPNNQTQAASTIGASHRSRGGRLATHDWDVFWVEVALYVAKEDPFDKVHRTGLRQHMLAWAAKQSPELQMDESTIGKKLKKLFDRIPAELS